MWQRHIIRARDMVQMCVSVIGSTTLRMLLDFGQSHRSQFWCYPGVTSSDVKIGDFDSTIEYFWAIHAETLHSA